MVCCHFLLWCIRSFDNSTVDYGKSQFLTVVCHSSQLWYVIFLNCGIPQFLTTVYVWTIVNLSWEIELVLINLFVKSQRVSGFIFPFRAEFVLTKMSFHFCKEAEYLVKVTPSCNQMPLSDIHSYPGLISGSTHVDYSTAHAHTQWLSILACKARTMVIPCVIRPNTTDENVLTNFNINIHSGSESWWSLNSRTAA